MAKLLPPSKDAWDARPRAAAAAMAAAAVPRDDDCDLSLSDGDPAERLLLLWRSPAKTLPSPARLCTL